ncbi:hypothetical protein DFJ74DRAFT_651177, partial [Hyaloraphidium curvatum]
RSRRRVFGKPTCSPESRQPRPSRRVRGRRCCSSACRGRGRAAQLRARRHGARIVAGGSGWQNDTESDDSRPNESIPQKRPRKDIGKGKDQAEPVPSSPKGSKPKKPKKKGYDAAAAAAQAALPLEYSAHLEQANVPTGCPALLRGNTDHWDAGHGDGSGCQLLRRRFPTVCGTCGELDHGNIAHVHPCDALVCTGRIWASRSKEELWEMIANGFLSEN